MPAHRSRLVLLALMAVLFLSITLTSIAAGGIDSRGSAGATHCKKIGIGHVWKQNGKKGKYFLIEGDRPSACVVGLAWLYRLTNIRVEQTPPGWQCLMFTSDVVGQCDNRKTKAVFEWVYLPR